jgi:hypothetical protein
MLSVAKTFHRKHARWVPIAFFLAGFVFDTLMLRHIDELKTILQQAVYLILSATLIGAELVESVREIHPPAFLVRVWKHREAALHFFLGTLLNSYTIFYFKSASTITSFFFIVFLVALLTINEFKRFGKSQTKVHVAFLSLCLISYLVSLVPILVGFVGTLPFLISMLASIACFYLFFRVMMKKLKNPELLRAQLVTPFAAIQLVFAAMFFAHFIPPVPLSVSYMGIFHDVKKSSGDYQLFFSRPAWKFWQHGDQDFQARPGDEIYCFARIFSPTRFKDELRIRWFLWNEKRGWLPSDAIPMPVEGGREEGYRAVTVKKNFQAGQWKVQIETADGREIGHIRLNVIPDSETEDRQMSMMVQ